MKRLEKYLDWVVDKEEMAAEEYMQGKGAKYEHQNLCGQNLKGRKFCGQIWKSKRVLFSSVFSIYYIYNWYIKQLDFDSTIL